MRERRKPPLTSVSGGFMVVSRQLFFMFVVIFAGVAVFGVAECLALFFGEHFVDADLGGVHGA